MKVNQNNGSFFIRLSSRVIIILGLFIVAIPFGFTADYLSKLKADEGIMLSDLTQTNTVNVFEVLAEPKEISIEKGSSGTIELTINRAADFTGQVNLSIFPSPGLPAYVGAPFTPSSVPANSSSSQLVLQVGLQAEVGTYNIVIAGTGSQEGVTRLRTVSISLTITDVQPAGVVTSFNFLDGNSALQVLSSIGNDITLDVQDLPEVINFSANTNGPVTAVAWRFRVDGTTNNIQTYLDNEMPYTLYPSGGWTVAPGVYELQAVQVNNGETGEVKSIVITITATPPPTFSIQANPSSLTIFQGESASTTIKLTPENNFEGQVDLRTDNLPQGVEGFFSITTLNTEGTSTLRLDVDQRAPVGSYTIIVQASGPDQISSSTTLEININRASLADFELSSNRSSLNIIRGEAGSVILTVKPLNGFNKTVSLAAVSSDNSINFEFRPKEINAGSGTAELTIFTVEEIDLGSLGITIFATSDTIERSIELALIIDPIPIALVPRNQFSPNGDGVDDLWVIEEIMELPDHTVVVFDRSGKEVFKAQPYKNDWNGKNQNGTDLVPTSYFFVVRNGAGVPVKTGSVNLLR